MTEPKAEPIPTISRLGKRSRENETPHDGNTTLNSDRPMKRLKAKSDKPSFANDSSPTEGTTAPPDANLDKTVAAVPADAPDKTATRPETPQQPSLLDDDQAFEEFEASFLAEVEREIEEAFDTSRVKSEIQKLTFEIDTELEEGTDGKAVEQDAQALKEPSHMSNAGEPKSENHTEPSHEISQTPKTVEHHSEPSSKDTKDGVSLESLSPIMNETGTASYDEDNTLVETEPEILNIGTPIEEKQTSSQKVEVPTEKEVDEEDDEDEELGLHRGSNLDSFTNSTKGLQWSIDRADKDAQPHNASSSTSMAGDITAILSEHAVPEIGQPTPKEQHSDEHGDPDDDTHVEHESKARPEKEEIRVSGNVQNFIDDIKYHLTQAHTLNDLKLLSVLDFFSTKFDVNGRTFAMKLAVTAVCREAETKAQHAIDSLEEGISTGEAKQNQDVTDSQNVGIAGATSMAMGNNTKIVTKDAKNVEVKASHSAEVQRPRAEAGEVKDINSKQFTAVDATTSPSPNKNAIVTAVSGLPHTKADGLKDLISKERVTVLSTKPASITNSTPAAIKPTRRFAEAAPLTGVPTFQPAASGPQQPSSLPARPRCKFQDYPTGCTNPYCRFEHDTPRPAGIKSHRTPQNRSSNGSQQSDTQDGGRQGGLQQSNKAPPKGPKGPTNQTRPTYIPPQRRGKLQQNNSEYSPFQGQLLSTPRGMKRGRELDDVATEQTTHASIRRRTNDHRHIATPREGYGGRTGTHQNASSPLTNRITFDNNGAGQRGGTPQPLTERTFFGNNTQAGQNNYHNNNRGQRNNRGNGRGRGQGRGRGHGPSGNRIRNEDTHPNPKPNNGNDAAGYSIKGAAEQHQEPGSKRERF